MDWYNFILGALIASVGWLYFVNRILKSTNDSLDKAIEAVDFCYWKHDVTDKTND